jgi:diaminopimelate decarboxylase
MDVHLEHNRWVHVVTDRASDPPCAVADLVGISCGFDTITPDADLPEVEPGEVVAFLDTGAYQEACASNFNAIPRPATVLVRDAEAMVVRRAETIEDVFCRDVEMTSAVPDPSATQ